MMKERPFAKRACFPANHPCGRDRHPIDAAGLIGDIAADFLKAQASEELTLPGYVRLPFKTVYGRIIAAFFAEGCPANTKGRVFFKAVQQELKVIRIKGGISVEIADHFISQVLYPLLSNIECIHLRGKVSLLANRKVN